MFIGRPTKSHLLAFPAAERPVCVPYKRKPVRITCRVGAPAPTATVNKQRITKRAFDGRALHGLKFLCRVIFIRQFMFIRRPSERYSPMFSAAERPVCVPYKRKGTIPDRLIRQKDRKRKTVNIAYVRRMCIAWVEIFMPCNFHSSIYVYPSTERTSFAHVFHRGTPGVRSLQAETCPHYL